MAKAIAVCVCEKCGQTFEKKVVKRNRAEADKWEEWASEHITLCPECYIKELDREEQAKPLTLHICLAPFSKEIVLYWSGATKQHKDKIKALGYYFGEPIATEGGLPDWLGISRPQKAWTKSLDVSEDIQAELEAAKSVAEKIVNNIRREDVDVLRQIMEKEQKKQAAIAQIPKPSKPDVYPTGRWNKKVYGSGKNGFSIYVDGEKVGISAAEKQALEEYLASMEEYNKKINDIQYLS